MPMDRKPTTKPGTGSTKVTTKESVRRSRPAPLWVEEVGSGVTRMPSAPAKSGVPRVAKNARIDLEKAPLAPREAYLLSRIDGVASAEDLADLCGMGIDEVNRALERLVRLGLVLVS